MPTLAVITLSLIATAIILRPRLEMRRCPSAANGGCSECTCLISYLLPALARGPDMRLRLTRSRRNFMLAGYGWREPQG